MVVVCRARHSAGSLVQAVLYWTSGKTCCSRFAQRRGQTKYSSEWLNTASGLQGLRSWESDGTKNLSVNESRLVDLAIEHWKMQGRGGAMRVPKSVDNDIWNSLNEFSPQPGCAIMGCGQAVFSIPFCNHHGMWWIEIEQQA